MASIQSLKNKLTIGHQMTSDLAISSIFWGVIILSVLYSDNIGHFYDELTGQASKEQTTEAADTSINIATSAAPKAVTDSSAIQVVKSKNNHFITAKQIKTCISLAQEFDHLKSQHDLIASEANFEREEYKLYKDDIKELKKELKEIDKEIISYQNTLDSYRQPVQQNQVDEYNDFTDQHNRLVDSYTDSEDLLNEVIDDLNASSRNFHRLKNESKNLSKPINQLGDKIHSQCIDNKKAVKNDLAAGCINKQENYFCKNFKR